MTGKPKGKGEGVGDEPSHFREDEEVPRVTLPEDEHASAEELPPTEAPDVDQPAHFRGDEEVLPPEGDHRPGE